MSVVREPMPAAPTEAVALEAMQQWGEAVGRALRLGDVLLLSGDLGAGKTTLSQAICRGLGVTEPVTSPTFTVVHEYVGAVGPVRHLDLYRLRSARELDTLGWDEHVGGDAVVLVEWPERAAGRLPEGAWHLRLESTPSGSARRVTLARE